MPYIRDKPKIEQFRKIANKRTGKGVCQANATLIEPKGWINKNRGGNINTRQDWCQAKTLDKTKKGTL